MVSRQRGRRGGEADVAGGEGGWRRKEAAAATVADAERVAGGREAVEEMGGMWGHAAGPEEEAGEDGRATVAEAAAEVGDNVEGAVCFDFC